MGTRQELMSRQRWRRSMQLATIRGCHWNNNQIHSSQLKTCASLKLIYMMLVCARDQQLPSQSVARGKTGANPLLVSQLCCEEEASYDVSSAYSFTTSQGLTYEEHHES